MDLSDYPKLVVLFIVAAIVIGISGTTLTEVGKTQCNTTVLNVNRSGSFINVPVNPATDQCFVNTSTIASNATGQGLSGVTTFSTWLPTIAVIAAAAIVITLIAVYFRT